jgi:hypothetical protein
MSFISASVFKSMVSGLAYDLQTDLEKTPLKMSRGQIHEIIAAFLGYGSKAAYATEMPVACTEYAKADSLVLDFDGALERYEELGFNTTYRFEFCLHAAKKLETVLVDTLDMLGAHHPDVHRSEEDYTEIVLRERVMREVDDSGEVSAVMAETNAFFDETYIEDMTPSEPLRRASSTWTVRCAGEINGESEPEKGFLGDCIKFRATVLLTKLGRIGVKVDSVEVDALVDESFYD